MSNVFYIKGVTEFASHAPRNFCHMFWGHFLATLGLLHDETINRDTILHFEWNRDQALDTIGKKIYTLLVDSPIVVGEPTGDHKTYTFDQNKYALDGSTDAIIEKYTMMPYVKRGVNKLKQLLADRIAQDNNINIVLNRRSDLRRIYNEDDFAEQLGKLEKYPNVRFFDINTGRQTIDEQFDTLLNADIYLYYHGAGGVFSSILRDDAIVFEIQPSKSWHTAFMHIVNDFADYNPKTASNYIICTDNTVVDNVGEFPAPGDTPEWLDEFLSNINRSNFAPIFDLSCSPDNRSRWRYYKGEGRKINFARIVNVVEQLVQSDKKISALSSMSASLEWLNPICEGRGYHLYED